MRRWYATMALLLFFGSPAFAMPRGSYLKRPAPNSASLLAQVRMDSSVRRRYVALWNISDQAVLKRISNLRLMRLPQEMDALVYYWRIEFGFHQKILKPGTLVFATPDGTPTLLQVCGNPIERFPNAEPRRTLPQPEDPILGERPDPTSIASLQREPELSLASDPIPTDFDPGDPVMISLSAPHVPYLGGMIPVGSISSPRLPWGMVLLLLSFNTPHHNSPPPTEGPPTILVGNGIPPGIAGESLSSVYCLIGISGMGLLRRTCGTRKNGR